MGVAGVAGFFGRGVDAAFFFFTVPPSFVFPPLAPFVAVSPAALAACAAAFASSLSARYAAASSGDMVDSFLVSAAPDRKPAPAPPPFALDFFVDWAHVGSSPAVAKSDSRGARRPSRRATRSRTPARRCAMRPRDALSAGPLVATGEPGVAVFDPPVVFAFFTVVVLADEARREPGFDLSLFLEGGDGGGGGATQAGMRGAARNAAASSIAWRKGRDCR